MHQDQSSIPDDLNLAIETGVVSRRLASYLLAQFLTFNQFKDEFGDKLIKTLNVDLQELEKHCTKQLLASMPPVDGFRCFCNAALYVFKESQQA